MDSWAKIAAQTEGDLLRTLQSPNFSDRQIAQRYLERHGEKVRPALMQILRDERQPLPARLHAVGALHSLWNEETRAALITALSDESADMRRLAAEGLGRNCKTGDAEASAALVLRLTDRSGAVRRAAALAIGRLQAEDADECLVAALLADEGKDVFLRDGYLRAIERLGSRGIERLVQLAESGVDREIYGVVEAFRGLQTRPAAEAVPRLLANPHLKIDQRARLVRSYGNYLFDPPLSLEPLAQYLITQKEEAHEVKAAGLEVMAMPGVVRGRRCEEVILSALGGNDEPLWLPAIKALEEARIVKAAPRLAKVVTESTRPETARLAAVRALRVLFDDSVVPLLQQVLKDEKGASPSLLAETLRTLGHYNFALAQEPARYYLDSNHVPLQRTAIWALSELPEGARLVGDRFIAKRLPAELLPPVTEALRRHAATHPDLAQKLTEVMKGGLLLSLDKESVERVQNLVGAKGNPERGKELFLNNKTLACVTCHRLEGVGSDNGPTLTGVWNSHTVEKIMESIIDPSKEIKEGFQTFVATTTKGQVFTGLRVSQTAQELVLRDADAKEIRIPAKELDKLEPTSRSLMPDNVVSQLTFDQFIDLVAFLKDRGAQESLQGVAAEFWITGPVEGGLDTPAPAPPPPNGRSGGDWQARQAEPSGRLDLGPVLTRPKTTAYFLTHVFSPEVQKARLLAGSGDAMKIWLNGNIVLTSTAPRAAAPDQDSTEVTLQQGWNAVLGKVAYSGTDHAVYLRFAGGKGLRVVRQPSGN
jgi:putative heme-binding domain-containing protein